MIGVNYATKRLMNLSLSFIWWNELLSETQQHVEEFVAVKKVWCFYLICTTSCKKCSPYASISTHFLLLWNNLCSLKWQLWQQPWEFVFKISYCLQNMQEWIKINNLLLWWALGNVIFFKTLYITFILLSEITLVHKMQNNWNFGFFSVFVKVYHANNFYRIKFVFIRIIFVSKILIHFTSLME